MITKQFVDMEVLYTKEGQIIPNALYWDNGKRYEIDRITDVRQAASLKAGGAGVRYTCFIMGKERYVFLDEGKWFVEAK